MANFKLAWNDEFPPLNLWNYPMNYPPEIQERIHEDALQAKKDAATKQKWLEEHMAQRRLIQETQVAGIANTNVKTVNDIQYGGNHYKTKAIQPWDYISSNGMGFLEGSIIKYVSRYQDKNGIEDLKKARHFLDKLIEVKSAGK